MPYIKKDRRAAIDAYLVSIDCEHAVETGTFVVKDIWPQDCGELNYAFTMVCLNHKSLKYAGLDWTLKKIIEDYLHNAPLRYQRINDVAGALACAALELQDRTKNRKFEIATLRHAFDRPYIEIAVDYEKQKITENGDIAAYGSPR